MRMHRTWKSIGRDAAVTLGLLFIATVVAFVYHSISDSNINVIMFYTLALLLIPRLTEGYMPGILAACVSVVCVNYLFTYPYFKINFILSGYPLTFIIMLAISLITSAATSHMKKQARILTEREKMLAEAGKEKMRANLLRAVSHDLRTPLTGIIGAGNSYLENEGLLGAEEKTELVRHIREDSGWLLNMVENLLTVTRISDDSASVNKSSEPVEEVLAEAVFRLKKRMPEAAINVQLPDEFCMIPMDAILIEQVLINLMENAVFHAKSEQPVELWAETGADEVTFFVKDYGVGIPEDRLSTIFDGVGQEEGGNADGHKGMGIGLTICKTIILAHGGTILAQNHGQGAEFSFTLPKEVRD